MMTGEVWFWVLAGLATLFVGSAKGGLPLIGTLAVMHAAGFTLNTLSLFGLVLSIGIVVDDAIVVVENVERHLTRGLKPRDAALAAMQEVTGPILVITAVLAAVFTPTAFMGGLSGQFYQQFALTIAISTVLSAVNSLTLSPALAAMWLKPHAAGSHGALQRFFGGFNRAFERENLDAAVTVLTTAGYRVHHARPVGGGRPLCCGRTYLAPGQAHFGKVRYGAGNNNGDRTEGARHKNAIGTYLHGSLLPKNPALADALIVAGLRRRYGPGVGLEPLEDTAETGAHANAVRITEKRRS